MEEYSNRSLYERGSATYKKLSAYIDTLLFFEVIRSYPTSHYVHPKCGSFVAKQFVRPSHSFRRGRSTHTNLVPFISDLRRDVTAMTDHKSTPYTQTLVPGLIRLTKVCFYINLALTDLGARYLNGLNHTCKSDNKVLQQWFCV